MLFCHIVSRTSVLVVLLAGIAVPTVAGLKACTTAAQTATPAPALAPSERSEPKAMSLVQLAELPRLTEPQLSPDGHSVAYMLGTADWTAGRLAYHLWEP